jgi:hypothetical protein
MKWMNYLLVILCLASGINGCALMQRAFYDEPHDMTIWDAKKIHPLSDLSDRHRLLTAQQSQLINKLYGQDISREGDMIVYYEARKRKGTYGKRGNIFLVQARGEPGSLDILVCTNGGRVDEILVKNNPVVDGRLAIPDEFLQQFLGRSFENSWEVALNPSDLAGMPSRIWPIAGYPKISREVADGIRKVLVWTEVLQIE